MSSERITLGQKGERLAAGLLKKEGYRILEYNYRGRLGEVDLIAEDGDCLVFVEVKTRRNLAFGHPLESIDLRKQRQLIKVAREYVAQKGEEERFCRFDAVAVLQRSNGEPPRLELVKNAFDLSGDGF
jgi:putative endonuclease